MVHIAPQAGEKDREDNMVDALGPHEIAAMENAELHGLRRALADRCAEKRLDGYGYYLYVCVVRIQWDLGRQGRDIVLIVRWGLNFTGIGSICEV